MLIAHLMSKSSDFRGKFIRFHLIVKSSTTNVEVMKLNLELRKFLSEARITAESFVLRLDDQEDSIGHVTFSTKPESFDRLINNDQQDASQDTVHPQWEMQPSIGEGGQGPCKAQRKLNFVTNANRLILKTLKSYSKESTLVILNLPTIPNRDCLDSYIMFVSLMVKDIENAFLVNSYNSFIKFDV